MSFVELDHTSSSSRFCLDRDLIYTRRGRKIRTSYSEEFAICETRHSPLATTFLSSLVSDAKAIVAACSMHRDFLL
jgi:hypothetical protein